MKHFMIDIETLSITVNAAVLSIGAVEFDPYTGDILRTFYRDLDLNQDTRKVNMATVTWWMQQVASNPNLAKTFADGDRVPVAQALHELDHFLTNRIFNWRGEDFDKIQVWACDPDFDLSILASLYADYEIEVPWRFYETRSVRTMREIASMLGVELTKQPATHDALDDCICQAREVGTLTSFCYNLKRSKTAVKNAYDGLRACRVIGGHPLLLPNVDNMLKQVQSVFNFPEGD